MGWDKAKLSVNSWHKTDPSLILWYYVTWIYCSTHTKMRTDIGGGTIVVLLYSCAVWFRLDFRGSEPIL